MDEKSDSIIEEPKASETQEKQTNRDDQLLQDEYGEEDFPFNFGDEIAESISDQKL